MSEYKDGHGDYYLAAGLSEELEEARAYAASLLDRIWSLGQELERVRTALHSGGLDVERLRAAIDGHVSEECPYDACFGECAGPISERYARLPAEVE